MKNIAILNAFTGGSTGNIAINLYSALMAQGYSTTFCYAIPINRYRKPPKNNYRIGSKFEYLWHLINALIWGNQGFYSHFATFRFIHFLKRKKIDTIYVLNIHEFFINERLFFKTVGKMGVRLIYILTDEYAFLGRCCFNDDCNHYLTGCGGCPSIKKYPPSLFFDRSKCIFSMKKEAYAYLSNSVFVGPEYVINKAKNSPLLNNKQLFVLDEAIDVDLFSPCDNNRARKELAIPEDKKIILCIAPDTDPRKGCEYFLELVKSLNDNPDYFFIHIGSSKAGDNDGPNFLSIGYISDLHLLAKYFSVADLFVFPSLSDSMSNACLDALACGTPLLCFNISGMPYLGDKSVLTLVEPKNVQALTEAVLQTTSKSLNVIKTCREYALSRYNQNDYFKKLIVLGNTFN